MDENLSIFIKSLKSLKETVDEACINEAGFQAYGWNQVHLNKEHISYVISNQISKLKSYGDKEVTEGFLSTINSHIEKIDLLNTNSKSYFTNNANQLIQSVPGILHTLQVIFSDIDYELFSYENIQDKKLLPRGLAVRLRSANANLDKIDESSGDLKSKIDVINEAHEAAESLPTDLASLQEAKNELTKLISAANTELNTAKKELSSLKEETIVLKNEAKKAGEEVETLKEKATSSADEASKLVEECDDALQITTTQGLAAGFDQKAKELKKSIWVWIAGLLIALGAGAWIGAERVEAFTQVLTNDLTAGQAILHTIMSIFSIGGPLWLAWISTQQINQRFKLSEDYSYKATVAKSFTGFKKFAERFDPSTEERLFNSTLDRLDEMPLRLIEGKDYNSPWHEFTDSDSFKTAISMFPTLAKEAGKFANKADLKKKPKQPKANTQPETKVQTPEPQSEAE
jgi:predicted transcriptional regulator